MGWRHPHLQHRTKVRIVLTLGATTITLVSVSALLLPELANSCHIGAATMSFLVNLLWIWEEV